MKRVKALPIDSPLRNQRGQGLIEYIIIVALIGVAAIAIVRTMSEAVNTKFASITGALQAKKIDHSVDIDASSYKRRKDLSDFMNGVEARGKGD